MNNNLIKAQDIANNINMDKSTTSELIRRLEKEGLVNRIKDENDKRAFNISLTNKTLNICSEAFIIGQSFNNELYSKLSKRENEILLNIINKLT